MKKTTLLLIILLAIFFTSTLVLLYLNFAKNPTSSITPTTGIIPTEEITPTIIDSTADWKTYQDTKYGYQFSCPPTSVHKIQLTTTDGTSKPYKDEICSENRNQVSIQVLDPIMKTKIPDSEEGIYQEIKTTPDKKFIILIQGFDSTYFDQILSTFKFTKPTTESSIPKPISDFFAKINQKFGLNIVPTAENEFYSPSDMIAKKSWKLDLTNTPVDKSFVTFLHQQLQPNDLESGGVGGGGVDAYQNSQIKCYHIYGYRSGDPTNWTDPFSYLSCAEK